ncbi:hypothetical protein NLI96_g8103 [Meripilus lineatus]|uniref:Uncharacterized protein n=1 Tax=Meripilus lineatus TaxID=2056292 RepID=A0AAD5UXY3_9APHY|nr:hypothetical protein NLI96_g8103 [Physisporinus lineatus]
MTLVLASLKTGCPEIGRQMIEDWLSKRNPASSYQDLDGYTKIIELYTLQVLPALEEWDYASEFLQYEPELVQMFDNGINAEILSSLNLTLASIGPSPMKTGPTGALVSFRESGSSYVDALGSARITLSLRSLRSQAESRAQSILAAQSPIPPRSADSSRTASPAPSISSESSSSTHTATPLSPRPSSKSSKSKVNGNGRIPSVSRLTPSSSTSSSQSVSSTATSKTVTPKTVQRSNGIARGRAAQPNGKANGHAVSAESESPNPSSSSLPLSRLSRSRSSIGPTSTTESPSTLTILKSYFDISFLTANKSKTITFVLLFVIVPIVSFVLRLRRRRIAGVAGTSAGAAVEVRRRLRTGNAQGRGPIAMVWDEFVRAVGDTVRMGGRGLV